MWREITLAIILSVSFAFLLYLLWDFAEVEDLEQGFMLGRGFLITDRPDTCRGVAQPQGQFPLQIGAAALLRLLSCCHSKSDFRSVHLSLLFAGYRVFGCLLKYVSHPTTPLYILLTLRDSVALDRESFL